MTTSKACLVSAGDEDEPVLRLIRWRQKGLPVGQVERGDSLFLNLLFDHLLNRGGDHRSSRRQIRLGFVEPTLNTIRDGNLLLRCSKRWEDGEELDETHNARGNNDA